jgi:histidine phosphotransfer protein HptB
MDLKEMSNSLGLELDEFLEISGIFVETSGTDLKALQEALERESPGQALEAAHSIKGAAANLGFLGMEELARNIEMNAKRGSLQGGAESLRSLREKLAQLEAAMDGL